MRDIQFVPGLFERLGVPLRIVRGRYFRWAQFLGSHTAVGQVGRLSISIPWRSIHQKSVRLTLEQIHITLADSIGTAVNAEAPHVVTAEVESSQAEPTVARGESGANMLQRCLTQLVDNIEILVHDVSITMQNEVR